APRVAGARPARPSAARIPRIELGRFAWQDSHIGFDDESVDPPRHLAIEPLGFELTGLVLGGAPASAEPPPAKLRAGAVAPGLFDELASEGDIHPKLGGIDLTADLVFSGTGLHGTLLAPYLRRLGIEPALAQGKAGVRIHAELRRQDGWRGGLVLQDA